MGDPDPALGFARLCYNGLTLRNVASVIVRQHRVQSLHNVSS
jgi:hypothetical protein